MGNKIKVAVIGAGRLGGFHAQKLAALHDVELAAVVDPLPQARQRVAKACRTAALADHREILAKVDAAIIAAPTRVHHKLALDFLQHGVHLLIEKPICATLAEADEVVEAARRQGVVLQVGHVERFNPAFTAAAPQMRKPKYIEAVRTGGFTFRSMDVGVVLDLMIHDIELVLWLVRSRVRRVDALGLSVLGGEEDVANARVEFDCGCVASLSACRVGYQPVRRMQIFSAQGYAEVDFAGCCASLIRPSETLLRRQFHPERLSPEQVEHYRKHLLEEHLPRQRLEFAAVDALALEVREFIDSIQQGREPRVTGAAGRDALAVAEQILDRIHTHAWDESADGAAGPRAEPQPRVIPAPLFPFLPADVPVVRREAG